MKYLKKFKTDVDYSIKRKNEYEEPWVSLTVAKGEVESFVGTPTEPEASGVAANYSFVYYDGDAYVYGSPSYIYGTNVSEEEIISVEEEGGHIVSFTITGDFNFTRQNNVVWNCESAVPLGEGEIESVEFLSDFGASAATVNNETFVCVDSASETFMWMGADLVHMLPTGKLFYSDGPVSPEDIVVILGQSYKETFIPEEGIVAGEIIKVCNGDSYAIAPTSAGFQNRRFAVGNVDLGGSVSVLEITGYAPGKEINRVDYNKTEHEWLKEVPFTVEVLDDGEITWGLEEETIQYSKNGGEWTTWDGRDAISVSNGDEVQFRANKTKYGRGEQTENLYCSAPCNLKGNIMSLLSMDDFSTMETIPSERAFYNIFNGAIISAKDLILPATTLADNCYEHMFAGCTSLTQAPELPAETLANGCYSSMFYGCTSLTQAPELPAETLANGCYSSMFYGCTSLTSSPSLPVTTLADGCYQYMFSGCISLTTAPSLPATTLVSACYRNMFYGCTSLTTPPALPATTLAFYCYEDMFNGCTSLTQAPELPATTLASNCYRNMFYGCTGLTTAPSTLPATTLADYCYYNMFRGCTSLTTAPSILPATALASNCYNSMFYNCANLTQAPELPAEILTNSCYEYMFLGCTSLNYVKCLATNISASRSHSGWLASVATSGTFVKDAGITAATWGRGTSGIPNNWTVQDA